MSACHGEDESVSIDSDDIPWTWQSLCFWAFVTFFIEAFLASANNSEYFFSGDVDLSDGMVFRVAEIDEVLILSVDVAQALWVVKLSFIVGTVYQPNLAVSDLILECHCVFIDNHHSIVCGVCYNNQVSI